MEQVIERDVLVIGAGHAGAQLAIALRRKDYSGSITVASDEATLPYERPPLSKAYFVGSIQIERLVMRDGNFWANQGIELALGSKVVALDTAASIAIHSDGRRTRFRWCVIATGGRARRLACPGAELEGVHYLRTVADVDAIRAGLAGAGRLAIIGAGYIGLEIAASARELGHQVTVIEAQDRVLARVTSPIVSNFYERQHRARGVDIRLNAQLAAIEGSGHVERILLASGERIDADLLVAGIGIDAETSLAEEAGIACDAGILTDESYRTSVPNVLAIGDCSRFPNDLAGGLLWRLESVQHAQDSAEIAADVIMGAPRPYREVPTFWSDQFDLKLQTVGLAKDADELVVRGDAQQGPLTVLYLRNGCVIAADAINSPRDFMGARALVRCGAAPNRAKLADPGVPLKSLV